MSTWKIYHNPKCSKSRQTLQILQDKGIKPEIIEYLKNPPNEKELLEIISKLNCKPHELLRKKEDTFKALNLDIENDQAVIKAMATTPTIIERPIVITEKTAVIGRPPENVENLF